MYMMYLHHEEFLWVFEVPLGRVVVENLLSYVDMCTVYQPLLYVLQHLATHRLKRSQLLSWKMDMRCLEHMA